MSSAPQRVEYNRRINRAMDYVEHHLADKITLEDLARQAAFSPFHFHRIFAALVGETVNSFIRRVRLERAASDLVVFRDRPITTVALDCGFTSPAVFARAFRARFGMTAGEWRQSGGQCGKTDRKAGQMVRKDGVETSARPRYAPPWWVRTASTQPEEEAMQVKIEDMPAIRAAYVRRIGPYMTEASKAWEALCRWAGPRNLIRPDSVWFSISRDDPDVTDKNRLRYDACLSVSPDVKPEGEIGIVELPARRVARGRYGPAAGIAGAWRALYGEWLPDSGFVPSDAPAIELYLMDQGNDPDHDHFVMDICVPIVPA